MSLAEALSLARQHDPTYLKAVERTEEAQALVDQAYAAAYPSVSSSLSVSQNQDALSSPAARFGGDAYNYYMLSVTAEQPIVKSSLWGAVRAGKKEKAIYKTATKISERDLMYRVLSSFHSALLARDQFETQKRIEKIQRDLLATASSRYRVGNEQLLSVLELKTTLLLLEQRVKQAETTFQNALVDLGNLIGRDSSTLTLRGSLDTPDLSKIAEIQNAKPTTRPELERLKLTLEQLDDLRTVTMSQHYPALSAFATWDRGGTQKSDLTDNDNSALSFGLRLSVPLFSGLSSVYQRRQLLSQISQTRLDEKDTSDDHQAALIKARANLNTAELVARTSTAALKQAQEAVQVAARTYRLGTSTYLQVSNAQKSLADAELNNGQARFEKIRSLADFYLAYNLPLENLTAVLSTKSL